jgi:PadR family transcriptional regulator, regulatory protein PadR
MPKTKEPRLSHQALRILRLFLQTRRALAGSDIGKETGIMSGTIYPVLARLERAKWLESRWEERDPVEAGRPRKRLYHLTEIGRRKASEAFTEIS